MEFDMIHYLRKNSINLFRDSLHIRSYTYQIFNVYFYRKVDTLFHTPFYKNLVHKETFYLKNFNEMEQLFDEHFYLIEIVL